VGISLTVPTNSVADQDAHAGSHIRTNDAKLANAIRVGLDQSATFRDLVNRIERTSGLVHIVSARCVTQTWEARACLNHNIRVNAGFRFLRVHVHPSESGLMLLALIAHELQHAFEVLSDDMIGTPENVEWLYQRIGTKARSGIVETDAALRMQDIVLREARERLGRLPRKR
jgi:hypothetical protein